MSITVRRFGLGEIALVRAIRQEALTVAGDVFASSLADEQRRDEAWYAEQLAAQPVWGVFRDDAVCGMAGLNRFDAVRQAHKAVLWGMYVAPALRGSGSAERLIEAILAHATAEGIEQVLLTCMASNARAIALYKRLGFIEWGREPRALKAEGVYHDDLHMIRRL